MSDGYKISEQIPILKGLVVDGATPRERSAQRTVISHGYAAAGRIAERRHSMSHYLREMLAYVALGDNVKAARAGRVLARVGQLVLIDLHRTENAVRKAFPSIT